MRFQRVVAPFLVAALWFAAPALPQQKPADPPKPLTVTDLGMLMAEGNGGWDPPVRSVFPAFKLYDPVLTEQMTVRDLVPHRSGLPRHDMVWYSSDFSRAVLIRRLQYPEPNKPLRSTFQYNNLMFMTAGYAAGLLDNTTWEAS